MKKLCEKYLDTNFVKVFEGGPDVAIAINNLPLDYLCFTGSTRVGKIVAQAAAKNLTPCMLELGGKCPAIVDHDADIQYSSSKLAFSKTLNSG